MEYYYEIDSNYSKRDIWLHGTLQKMSVEQLDVFFSAVENLVYNWPGIALLVFGRLFAISL